MPFVYTSGAWVNTSSGSPAGSEYDVAAQITAAITTNLAGRNLPVSVSTDESIAYAVTDSQDQAAIAVLPDGSVTIPKPSAATLKAFSTGAAPAASWSSRNGTWNAEKGLYNYHPTKLSHWFAALARAMSGEGTAHVATFIDSETFGGGVNRPMWLNSWPGRVRRQLDILTTYASGTGIAVPWNIITDDVTLDPRWTFGSAAAQLSGAGATATPYFGPIGKGAVQLTNNAGNGYVTFTPVGSVNRFVIYALADTGATGTATVKVDGSSVGTFDVSAAGGGGTLTRRGGTLSNVIVVDVPSLTSGTHTLRIEGPAASTVTIWGVEGGTGVGVRVSNLARSGTNALYLTLDDSTNHFYGMPLHIDTAKPDLVVLMDGLNERGKDPNLLTAQLSTAVDRIQAAGGDVLLVSPGHPDYTNINISGSGGDMTPSLQVLYAVADLYDIPLLDLAWVRKDWATANALGLLTDYEHSNDIGSEHHARFIINALTGA